MVHSSYYISLIDSSARPFSEPFFVLGESEDGDCSRLVAGAVARGVRTIVMEQARVSSYCRPFQQDLVGGVAYFFVRSLPATLSRWQAAPLVESSEQL